MKRNIVFFSAICGNILEYYDFTVYSVFSVMIGRQFFPETSPTVQVLASLAVFAVGFITRPIGGIIFGSIGDKYGRRTALIISMVGMTLTTFSMGLIPDYNQIGYLGSVLLVLMRLFQGLCISGEGTGTAIFVLEHFHNLRPGLVTGFVHSSNIAGTFLASMVGITIEYFYPGSEVAWRYAFLLGGLIGLLGFYLRLRVQETPIFLIISKKKKVLNAPFFNVTKSSWHYMLLTVIIGAATSCIGYLIKSYINIFYTGIMGYDNTVALIYLSYTSIVLMIFMPIAGFMSDTIGKLRMMFTSTALVALLCWPTLIMMGAENRGVQILSLTMFGALAGTIAGSAYIFIISLFRPEERFTGVGVSYNLGIALFGGTSPIIARWLVETTRLSYAPAFYITLNTVICLITLTIFSRKKLLSHVT